MKFRFSYDVTLPFGQYESSLKLHLTQCDAGPQGVAFRYAKQRSSI
jgi:hypothetical protein